MEPKVKVVIGANYGDEGKGLVSGYLSQDRKVLNVFYNGGSQRAHTGPDGRVHHCEGAGSYFGAKTFLNRWFLVDPIALWLEGAEVFIDPMCRVVVPSDAVNNRRKELAKRGMGNTGDGTCGMGIFEACKRNRIDKFQIYAKDLVNGRDIMAVMLRIRREYGFPNDMVYNNVNFLRGVEWIREHCHIIEWERLLKGEVFDTIVFEGGQGLMLDQSNKDAFPHLTPSSVGVRNIAEDIKKLGVVPELYYVSRSYLTRHGAGAIENPVGKAKINPLIEDRTNVPNPWQGSLRYGFINLESLYERVQKDIFEYTADGSVVKANLVFTQLNYTDGKLATGYNKEKWRSIEKPDWCEHVWGSYDKKEIGVLD